MPRFYFNLDGAPSTATSFDSIAEAKNEALRYLTQVAAKAPHLFWERPFLGMTVTDAKGSILFTLRLVGAQVASCS